MCVCIYFVGLMYHVHKVLQDGNVRREAPFETYLFAVSFRKAKPVNFIRERKRERTYALKQLKPKKLKIFKAIIVSTCGF